MSSVYSKPNAVPGAPTEVLLVGHMTRDTIRRRGRSIDAAGGTVLYAGMAYAGLGATVTVLTRAASAEATALSAPLVAAGCSVRVLDSIATTHFENTLSDDLATRRQRVLAVSEPFQLRDWPASAPNVVHLGALTNEEMPVSFIEAAARAAKLLVLDVQGFVRQVLSQRVVPVAWPAGAQVLPFCHIVKADASEAFTVTGIEEPERAALALNRMGAREALVTLADKGSYVARDGAVSYTPAFVPNVATDSTGAGDTYTAGYVFARLRGDDPVSAARFAAALASLSIENVGPVSATAEDVERRLSADPEVHRKGGRSEDPE